MNDIDEQLRSFRSTLDQAPEQALTRARIRVLNADSPRDARAWQRWVAIPAVAAGVAAVAITTSLVLAQAPPPSPTAPTAPTMPASPTALPRPTTLAEVAARIEGWALELESGPQAPPVAPGQTIVAVQVTNGDEATLTIEREAAIVIADSRYSDQASFQRYVDDQRATFAATGPSLRHPTAEWLESLDPSPENLRSLLTAACDCDTSEQQFATVEELLGRADLVLPPRVRAGLLRVLATLPGITAYEDTVDGRPYRMVALTGRGGSQRELLIDPATQRFAGAASLTTGRAPDLPQCATPSNPNDRTAQPLPTGAECQEVIPLSRVVRDSVTVWEQTLVTP